MKARSEPDTTAYEIEVAESRRRIADTVGAIQHRLNPRVIAHEVMDAAMERGRDAVAGARRSVRDQVERGRGAVAEAGRSVREHSTELSIAGVVIGAAIGALTLTKNRKSRDMTQYEDENDIGDDGRDTQGRLAGVRESAARVRERAAERAAAARGYTSERMAAARDRTAETWQSTRDRAGEYSGKMRDRTAEGVDQNPIIAILIGAAAGALIGALLPATRRENVTLGRASDRVKQSAREAARAAREAGKARFEELGVGDHAKQQLRELGRDAGEVAKSARQAATKGIRPNGNDHGREEI